MKTDQLIELLAHDVEPVDRRATPRTFAFALMIGGAIALVLMLVFLRLNPLLRSYLAEPMFWVKTGFGIAMAAPALWLAVRLARPGADLPVHAWLPLLPSVGLWLLALPVLTAADPASRATLVWGSTWSSCLIAIPALAMPVLLATLVALRSLATTRPVWAGAAAGAVAGGLAATVYALHCPELAAPFLALWYVLGAAVPIAIGAALGRSVLRW